MSSFEDVFEKLKPSSDKSDVELLNAFSFYCCLLTDFSADAVKADSANLASWVRAADFSRYVAGVARHSDATVV